MMRESFLYYYYYFYSFLLLFCVDDYRGWDAYLDFESRHQQMITKAPSSSPFYSSGGAAAGNARERIRLLTQRRNEALFASKAASSLESNHNLDETFVDEFA
jgi:hypothetical protein